MTQGISLSLEQLVQLRGPAQSLKLSCHKRVKTALMGSHRATLRGRGIDFDEVRIYQAGDDIRSMDWRVTARTGKPHTKLYHEERERPIFVVVDLTPSMFFATKVAFKSVIAAQTAALIGWAAIQNGDRLGAIIFHSADEQVELPPRSRSPGVLPVLKNLADQQRARASSDEGAALTNALSRLHHVAKPGSLIFLISDFQGLEEKATQQLSQLAKHTEIVALAISDPLESTPPPPARYAISNGEHITMMNSAINSFRVAYQQQFADERQQLVKLLQANHIPLIDISTKDNAHQVLSQSLRER